MKPLVLVIWWWWWGTIEMQIFAMMKEIWQLISAKKNTLTIPGHGPAGNVWCVIFRSITLLGRTIAFCPPSHNIHHSSQINSHHCIQGSATKYHYYESLFTAAPLVQRNKRCQGAADQPSGFKSELFAPEILLFLQIGWILMLCPPQREMGVFDAGDLEHCVFCFWFRKSKGLDPNSQLWRKNSHLQHPHIGNHHFCFWHLRSHNQIMALLPSIYDILKCDQTTVEKALPSSRRTSSALAILAIDPWLGFRQ